MMKKTGDSYLYSPSDLITFMRSDYASWLDRFDKEFPGRLSKDESDEMQQFLQQKGIAHEEAYLQLLQDQGKDVCPARRPQGANNPYGMGQEPSEIEPSTFDNSIGSGDE
jgi:hypothetical protein